MFSLLFSYLLTKRLLNKPIKAGAPDSEQGLISSWLGSKQCSLESKIDFHSCIYLSEELAEQNAVVATLSIVTGLRHFDASWCFLSDSELLVRAIIYIFEIRFLEEFLRQRIVYHTMYPCQNFRSVDFPCVKWEIWLVKHGVCSSFCTVSCLYIKVFRGSEGHKSGVYCEFVRKDLLEGTQRRHKS